jgi:hypothetical protein
MPGYAPRFIARGPRVHVKVHINFEFGGVPMPLTGAIPEGPSFFCPHQMEFDQGAYLQARSST